jgi:hypothetical protein
MPAEIIRGLDILEYHSLPSAWVSHSRFHDFVKHGPKFFEGRYLTGEIAREETDALSEGQGFEILYQRGGDEFAKAVAVRPAHLKGKGNTKDGIAWNAANADKIRIDESTYQTWLTMCEALNECTGARELIAHCEQQVTLRGEAFGLKMQARPDWVALDDMRPLIVDLKTTKCLTDLLREVRPGVYEPGPAVMTYGYTTQLALMRRLLSEAGYPSASVYLYIAEKTGLRAACVEMPEGMLKEGERYFEWHAPRLAECLRTRHFPRAVSGIVKLETPGWMTRQQEMQP